MAAAVVQAHFQQDGGRQFGERRAPAARPRLRDRGRDLGRVGQAELRAIERDQAPPAPKCVALPARGLRPQHAPHQLGKDLPRHTGAPIGPRTVGQRVVEQVREMLGQRPGILHYVKRQGGQQVAQRHAGFAPAPAGDRRDPSGAHHPLPSREKPRTRRGLRLRMCRHPQRKYAFLEKCTRPFSRQRISERH